LHATNADARRRTVATRIAVEANDDGRSSRDALRHEARVPSARNAHETEVPAAGMWIAVQALPGRQNPVSVP
jgi:hypothetical protein